MNDQLAFAASALPARSVAAVVIVAVYCVFAVSAAAGVTITVLPFTATVPAIRAPVPVRTSVTLAVVSVAFAIGSENVASTVGSSATDIAPSAGIVDVTVGATLSVGGAATVVNVATVLAASALPARSRTAVVIVIWYCVPAVNAGAGVNVAVFPLTDTEPVTGVADPIVTSWTLVAVMVLRVIASENVTDTGEFSATPVAPSAGDIAVTVGAVVSLGGPGGCVTSPPPPHANSAAHTTWVACRNLRTPRGRFAACGAPDADGVRTNRITTSLAATWRVVEVRVAQSRTGRPVSTTETAAIPAVLRGFPTPKSGMRRTATASRTSVTRH